MTYIQKTLAADESLLATGKMSKWALFHLYCAAVIFGVTIICLPISALLLLIAYLTISSNEMGVTDKRVIRKSGIIMRDTSEILLSKVESVSVKQGFLGRMFGYGDVVISGSGGNDAVMKGVDDPLAFRAKINGALEESRAKSTPDWTVDAGADVYALAKEFARFHEIIKSKKGGAQ